MSAPSNIDDILARILEDGEKVVWRGRPDPDRVAKLDRHALLYGANYLLFPIVFFLFVGLRDFFPPESLLLIVAWGFSSWTFAWIIAIVPIPVALFLFARPILNRRRARRAHYVVTNLRILIVSDRPGSWTASVKPEKIECLERTNSAGLSDIRFKESVRKRLRSWRVSNFAAFWSDFERGFWGISDGSGAESAIRNLRQMASEGPASVVTPNRKA